MSTADFFNKNSDLSFSNAFSKEALLVQTALQQQGIETPYFPYAADEKQQRRTEIAEKMSEVLTLIGLDLNDDSLQGTPERLAKMYVDEIFSGLDYRTFPKITKIANKMAVKEMVLVKDIQLSSVCEHHFLTIDGTVSLAYYPKDWVIGLSKLNRVVDFFAKRPQVQERFTEQVLLALQTLLETEDVAVYVQATHFCVKGRGIRDTQSSTVTSAFGGCFKDDAHRQTFLLQVLK